VSRWAYDADTEARWQAEIRQCLIQEAIERPEKWRPIIAKWRKQQRPGVEDLVHDIRRAMLER
jgi:hypothetical protein